MECKFDRTEEYSSFKVHYLQEHQIYIKEIERAVSHSNKTVTVLVRQCSLTMK